MLTKTLLRKSVFAFPLFFPLLAIMGALFLVQVTFTYAIAGDRDADAHVDGGSVPLITDPGLAEALVLMEMAEQGNAYAQYNLAVVFTEGRGVARDDAEAVLWYRRAAEQGLALAQVNLGNVYFTGRGVPKNEAEAVRWTRRAAEQGLAGAQSNLALDYSHGSGVPVNEFEAARWFLRAAEQGEVVAQQGIGAMYLDGRGVPKNFILAYKWSSLAAAQGNEGARGNLRIVERLMTRDQVAEAQRLAAAFRPRAETTLNVPRP